MATKEDAIKLQELAKELKTIAFGKKDDLRRNMRQIKLLHRYYRKTLLEAFMSTISPLCDLLSVRTTTKEKNLILKMLWNNERYNISAWERTV